MSPFFFFFFFALFSFRSSESFIVSYIFMTFLATSRTAEFHFCFGRYWCDHGRQTWKLTQTHTRSVLRRQTQSRLRVLCGEFRAYLVFDGTRVALYSYRKDHKNKMSFSGNVTLCEMLLYWLPVNIIWKGKKLNFLNQISCSSLQILQKKLDTCLSLHIKIGLKNKRLIFFLPDGTFNMKCVLFNKLYSENFV